MVVRQPNWTLICIISWTNKILSSLWNSACVVCRINHFKKWNRRHFDFFYSKLTYLLNQKKKKDIDSDHFETFSLMKKKIDNVFAKLFLVWFCFINLITVLKFDFVLKNEEMTVIFNFLNFKISPFQIKELRNERI